MKSFLFSILLSVISTFCIGQQVHMFRTIYYPAEPYGGESGLKEFFQQEFIYPQEELKNEVKADVYITYKISSKSELLYKEIASSGHPSLDKEAERIFDNIVWVKDADRSDYDLGFEKIKISFHPKKFEKLVKRRGYHTLPNVEDPFAYSPNVYSLNEVEEKPVFIAEQDINTLIRKNFKYPNVAIQQNVSGRVVLEFVIEPYGRASNIHIKKPVAGGCNEETIRLVKLMRWEPAKIGGSAVRSLSTYELNFINPGGSIH